MSARQWIEGACVAMCVATVVASGCAQIRFDDGGGLDATGDEGGGLDANDLIAERADAAADSADTSATSPRVLVFSRTAAFRHASIPAALAALRRMASTRSWTLESTEDPAAFEDGNLQHFDVVAFVLTSGDVLDATQQAAFERFVRGGHGFVGVHSASDTEYDWPFFGRLVGAYFLRHPPGAPPATILVEDRTHAASVHLPQRWMRADEWYTFRENPGDRRTVRVLATVDEDSYGAAPEFRMGDHPIAWYQYIEGGRSFHTALGHTSESYAEPEFIAHVAGGIEWAAGWGHPAMLADEFNGTETPGIWEPHGAVRSFAFSATRDRLSMTDDIGLNQHLTRAGLLLDANRPYLVEAAFTIPARSANGARSDLNSFCINFNVQGDGGRADDVQHLYAHAINLDLSSDRPGIGTMKHMGFVDGVFRQIAGGENITRCCAFDREYRLRIEVNVALDGSFRLGLATATLFEGRRVHERFTVDYDGFGWRPDRAQPVRVGVNTHGTDWTMRDFRVRYLDVAR